MLNSVFEAYEVLLHQFRCCRALYATREDRPQPPASAQQPSPTRQNPKPRTSHRGLMVREDDGEQVPQQVVKFHLDTGATRHIFNMALLKRASNVKELSTPVRYTGIGDGLLLVRIIADYDHFRRAGFSPDPKQLNLVSLDWMLKDGYDVSWCPWEKTFTFTHGQNPIRKLMFVRENRL